MEEPIFVSKINRTEIFINFSGLLLFCVAMFFRSINDDFNSKCFAGFLMLIFLILVLARFKTFILYKNELIVRRPFLTSKFDKKYEINKIRLVLFTFLKGRFGGNKMIVYSIYIDDHDYYSIYLKPNEIKLFVQKLEDISVEVVHEQRV